MKEIILDKERKALLIEMAEYFFPENKKISVQSHFKGRMIITTQGIEVNNGMISFPYKEMGNIDPYIARKYMHWVEFTMFQLAEKVFNPTPTKLSRNLKETLEKFYWNTNLYRNGQRNSLSIHPIQYLYNYFKILTNGK